MAYSPRVVYWGYEKGIQNIIQNICSRPNTKKKWK